MFNEIIEVVGVAIVIRGDDIRDGVEGMLVDSIPLDEMLNDGIVTTVILGDNIRDGILDPNEKGTVATVICGDDTGNNAECSLVNSALDETSSDDGIM